MKKMIIGIMLGIMIGGVLGLLFPFVEEDSKLINPGYYLKFGCLDNNDYYVGMYKTIENPYDNCLYTFEEYDIPNETKKIEDMYKVYNENLKYEESEEGYNVFLGDSITRYYLEFFEMDENSINVGIPGATTYDLYNMLNTIYFTLPTESINNLFILIGTNDNIMNTQIDDYNYQYSVEILNAIVSRIKKDNPNINVFVIAPFVTNPNVKLEIVGNTPENILEYNKVLKENLTTQAIYIDINEYITDDNGNFRADYTDDGVHPNKKGYEKIKEALKEEVKNTVTSTI